MTNKKSTNKVGAPTKYTKGIHDKIISLAEAKYSNKEICKIIGIAESTLYDWKTKHPKLEIDLERCKAVKVSLLVEKAYEMAIEGGDGNMLRWLIARYEPEKWGKQVEERKEEDNETIVNHVMRIPTILDKEGNTNWDKVQNEYMLEQQRKLREEEGE